MHKSYKENIEFLKTCDSSFVADALSERFHLSNFSIDFPRPFNSGERFVGPAITVSYRRDTQNEESVDIWSVLDNYVDEGDVLVLGDANDVLIGGDVIARYIQRSGACAVLTDGKIRDGHIIKDLGMPVFCMGLSTCLPKYRKEMFRLNAIVEMFGVTIHAGDILVGDEDGVVVIPKDLLDDVAYEVEDIAHLEEEYDIAFDHGNGLLDEIKRIGKLKHTKRDER